MIVITHKNETVRCVMSGDTFNLSIDDQMGCHVIIREEIKVNKVIDFIASFRFALDDGTCPGFHLMGVFACKSELPEELKKAVMLEDLTPKQYENFVKSVGVKIEPRKKRKKR
jgi:hypothetical protein